MPRNDAFENSVNAGSGLIDELTNIVSRAAAAILAARAGALAPQTKPDASPVTAADHASEAIILEGLSRALPGVAVVSEEAGAPPTLTDGVFALVDPLDGTRELIAGRDEFCVNLALVSAGRPQLGIIAAPAAGLIWRTAAGGGAERMHLAPGAPVSSAAERTPIRTRRWPQAGAIAAVSRSSFDARTQAFLAQLPPVERIASGSALKLCWLAEGSADVYPRLAPVCEWDVAAGDAILSAAGGLMTSPAGTLLSYGNSAERYLVRGFIAWGDPTAREALGLAPDRGERVN
jgi:3'(2'), 5'-bisphosphate nucleotidase